MEMIRRRKRLSEPEARLLSLQLLDALRYMHTNKVIHRDLKLGNLFLDSSMEIKVGDLGLATLLSHETERKRTICGTPNYIAPEILMNASDGHSFEVDMWSFGVILYTLVVGKPPFETKDVKTTYRRIKENKYAFPTTAPISEAATDLITQLLAHDPKQRATLTTALQHPWFTDPSAVVPARLPVCSLTALPHFSPSELRASADVVADILAVIPGPLRVRASARRSTPVDANGRSTDENTYTSMQGKPITMGKTAAAPAAPVGARAPLGRVDMNAWGGMHTHSRPAASSAAYGSATAAAGFSVYSGPENTAQQTAPVVQAVAPPQVPASAPSLGGLTAPPASSSTPPPRAAVSAAATSSHAAGGGSGGAGEVETLKKMHATLRESFNAAGQLTGGARNLQGDLAAAGGSQCVPEGVPPIWVSTWVDYTTKYGVGYLLCNGSVGVYFNDSTKIVLASDGEHFEYIDRCTTVEDGRGAKRRADALRQAHCLSSFPADLKKKVTLLKHFKSHLLEEQGKKGNVAAEEAASLAGGSPRSGMEYVKKWVRTRHALLFRLSNKTVQVSFMDGTSITLCSELPAITYVGKDGSRSHHLLASINSEERGDISKRLKYTKDILQQLISGSRR